MGPRLDGAGHVRVRPDRRAGAGVRDRHPAADGQRLAAHGVGVRLRPDRQHRPLPADARQDAVLPDGLGRQRPADRAPGAELLRGALRPRAAVRPGVRAAGQPAEGPGEHRPADLRRAVPAADRGGREGLRAALAHARPVGGLGADLHDDRPGEPAGLAAGLPAQPGPGRGVRAGGADAVGRRTSGPPSRRPSSRTASSPPPTTGSASRARTASRSSSRPRGRSCCRPASRWWRTRTTRATSRCSAAP